MASPSVDTRWKCHVRVRRQMIPAGGVRLLWSWLMDREAATNCCDSSVGAKNSGFVLGMAIGSRLKRKWNNVSCGGIAVATVKRRAGPQRRAAEVRRIRSRIYPLSIFNRCASRRKEMFIRTMNPSYATGFGPSSAWSEPPMFTPTPRAFTPAEASGGRCRTTRKLILGPSTRR